ncbi:MAG: O-antigen ligase family protein [Marinisporobacter sp.]|jgi:O-antigen ligase|nr:O-antigen ligase family protein [Marinisporobacter sp.]
MIAKIKKIKTVLIYLLIITLPMMIYIRPSEDSLINFAVSDIFMVFIVLLFYIDILSYIIINRKTLNIKEIKEKFKEIFPYSYYFLGLLAWMMLSNIHGYANPNIQTAGIFATILEMIKFIISACYFFIAYNSINHKNEMTKLFRVWRYTALVVGLLGVIGTVAAYNGNSLDLKIFLITKSKRLVSTLTDPNLAAAYFSISFHITMLFIKKIENRLEKSLSIVALVVLITAIIFTQSRSGTIAFITSLCIYFLFNIKYYYKYTLTIVLILLIVFFGFINIDANYFDGYVHNIIENRFEEITAFSGEAKVRTNLGKCAYEMGKDHVLLGVGRGNYRQNSKEYFEKIGVDVSDKNYYEQYGMKIPHNTYATFFAELGLLGVFLFICIFIILFKKLLKNNVNNKTNIILVALLTSFLIQAFAINLENFRGIWVASGLIFVICKIDVEETGYGKGNSKILKHELSNKKRNILTAVLMIVFIFAYLSAVGKIVKPIKIKNIAVEYIEDIQKDTEYIFNYNISEEEKDEEGITYIRIYSIHNKKREFLNKIDYYTPNGTGNLLFKTKSDTEKVMIEIDNRKNGNITLKDAKLVCKETGIGQIIFADYKYLPQSIESNMRVRKFVNNEVKVDIEKYRMFADNILKNNDYEDIKSTNEKLVYFNGEKPINLSDRILFLGSTIEKIDKNKCKIKFRFRCIEKLDVDYRLWFHGSVIDDKIVLKERQKYGFENWDHSLPIKATNWEIGKIYEHEKIITINQGQYNLKFGFFNSKNNYKAVEVGKLYPSVELGWIQIK